jgi:uncharacterized protein (DUF952 family)
MKPILHITSKSAWEAAQKIGFYSAPSLVSEGFIHCSTPAQALATARRFYAGQSGLVLLIIDPARVKAELKFEVGTDKPDELFPHIYGPLNLDAVTGVPDFASDSAGNWVLPPL